MQTFRNKQNPQNKNNSKEIICPPVMEVSPPELLQAWSHVNTSHLTPAVKLKWKWIMSMEIILFHNISLPKGTCEISQVLANNAMSEGHLPIDMQIKNYIIWVKTIRKDCTTLVSVISQSHRRIRSSISLPSILGNTRNTSQWLRDQHILCIF